MDTRNSSQEELQLVLQKEAAPEENQKRFKQFCYPPEGSTLTVQVDTRQLKRQRSAIGKLKSMHHECHEKLIRLFEKRDAVRWENVPRPCPIENWHVLKDKTRSGCAEQREFVLKALGTPDFAVLEVPPGSGKTTVILELICRIASMGKRVLLCDFTNVAIDNVLERLIEERDGGALLEQAGILPVRIGHPDRVDENIAEYQIDRLVGMIRPKASAKRNSFFCSMPPTLSAARQWELSITQNLGNRIENGMSR